MSARFGWWWVVLAGALTVGALVTSDEYSFAVPLAAAAVLAAGLAVADTARRLSGPRPAGRRVSPVPTSGVRDWIRAGELGREDLLLLLDRLERKAVRPDLPARTPEEIGELVMLRPEKFSEYIEQRVASLERYA